MPLKKTPAKKPMAPRKPVARTRRLLSSPANASQITRPKPPKAQATRPKPPKKAPLETKRIGGIISIPKKPTRTVY